MRLVVSHPAAFPLCRELIEVVRPAVDRAEEKEDANGRPVDHRSAGAAPVEQQLF